MKTILEDLSKNTPTTGQQMLNYKFHTHEARKTYLRSNSKTLRQPDNRCWNMVNTSFEDQTQMWVWCPTHVVFMSEVPSKYSFQCSHVMVLWKIFHSRFLKILGRAVVVGTLVSGTSSMVFGIAREVPSSKVALQHCECVFERGSTSEGTTQAW